MKNNVRKLLSLVLTLVLTLSAAAFVNAEESGNEIAELLPLLDTVCSGAQYSANAPEHIGDSSTTLSGAFADSFLMMAASGLPELGVSNETLADPAAQAQVLSTVFAAKLPELSPITTAEDTEGCIGFLPRSVKAEGNTLQVIGETYFADKPMRELADSEYGNIQWLDRAIFLLEKDAAAFKGWRIVGFGEGVDLTFEEQFRKYYEDTVIEYQSALDFMISVPTVFEDLCVESQDGVSATLPDGSVSFFVIRSANKDRATLGDYVSMAAAAQPGCKVDINTEMQYGIVRYLTDDGFTVFNAYAVTEGYIYQAQFKYLTALSSEYAVYEAYLENSFVVSELSQG